ncbi:hypothetical protein AB0C59_24710 [Streptomyces sp. NPDC048664]|uniref:hypothetical protein n=1 Tax=Streptomyces sp. NPDC048664 TaxID=3154505 RepID=UPI00342E837F
MIQPHEIPQFTGDLEQLEKDHGGLKKDAGHIRTTGADTHSKFQGLSAYYTAPEAEQLFASTKPVSTRADSFATDLETVASALAGYATEVRPLAAKLKQLKHDAQAFVDSVKDDDDWQYDGDKVDKHNQIRDDVTATVAAFWAAERTCHNKITALWRGGTQMIAGDGSNKQNMYGYDASDLKGAKGLPWGDPVEQKHHWYDVGHWAKSFLWDGIVVDGIWGTIKGLGTLVGFQGWDAMKQAWKGLAQLATGLAFMSNPITAALFWATPDKYMPSWLRDSRNTMKATGKALVAWDEWGKNPARAAGAVTFNVLTTVFTGGEGAAVAGAGKAGAVSKAISVAGKVGKVMDPMTYVMKGAGAGLSKIGDITKTLKGAGKIDIPKIPDNAITLPEGTVHLPDGTVRLPEGASIPKGGVELPNGAVELPHDTPVVPAGTEPLHTPAGEPPLFADHHGNIVDQHGNVLLDTTKPGPPDITHSPHAGADTPHTPSPTREPALVGAAPHTADTAGHAGEHIRLGDSVGHDLADFGRTGEHVPTAPGVQAGGDIPGVHAGGDLPGGGPGSHLPGGTADHLPGGTADHLPGGRADSGMPTNSVDHHAPAGTPDHTVPGPRAGDHAPGGHTGDIHTPGHDAPGHGGDGHVPGHGAEPHSGGSNADDLVRSGNDAPGTGDHADPDTAGDSAGNGSSRVLSGHPDGVHPTGKDWYDTLSPHQIKDVQVYRANHEPGYYEKYYRQTNGRRLRVAIVDESGFSPPHLKRDPNDPSQWIAAKDKPSPFPEKYVPGSHVDRGPETVPTEHGFDIIREAGHRRHASVVADNAWHDPIKKAKAAYLLSNTPENLRSYKEIKAQHAPFHERMGSDSENFGEAVARHHVIPENYRGYEWEDLAGPRNGNDQFDQLWSHVDEAGVKKFVVIEAKGSRRLDLGMRELPNGFEARQGSIEYFKDILRKMRERGMDGDVNERRLYRELKKALTLGNVDYVLVKAKSTAAGEYAGYAKWTFDIS